jgi:Flp pilus assembly protein TadG
MEQRLWRWRQRGQSLVEFSLTVGLLMILVVATAQVAIFIHFRNSLDLITKEGAFQASLVGHQPRDGEQAAKELWAKIEPGGGSIEVQATRSGDLIVVTAKGFAPAIVPVPVPPFNRLPVSSRSVHTVEQFKPGSSP